MTFFLCRDFRGEYTMTNFRPYRNSEDLLKSFYYYYPHWLGGNPFVLHESGMKKSLGGDIERGTIKRLDTEGIILYDDLLTMEDWDNKIYYSFGL